MNRTALIVIASVVLLGWAHAAEAQALTPAQMESYRRLTNQLIAPSAGGNRLLRSLRLRAAGTPLDYLRHLPRAVTLAKQRLMAADFDYYELAHPDEGVGSGFGYKTAPHVTLKSIANNPEIREGMTRELIDEAIARDDSRLLSEMKSEKT